ncbi:hypothetical protein FB45DRAFT_112492 [Roridomyces roridus]|uniref:F-box domain-containing protein n=1 Tax=Roridomyces roridus TaxID=1738132 RepID=A0AAD7FK78_9AGAR|nr:hypothetical protein FB45DRAFT_112492 [Roridomyces roridus]
MNDLPPELHALILGNLPYYDLLRVKRVAKKWKAIVESDPALQVQTFKRTSPVYISDNPDSFLLLECESQPIKLHLALQRWDLDWKIGEPISDAKFILLDNTAVPLTSIGVLQDLATIPAVHRFTISLGPDHASPNKVVENSQGIRVLDVFEGILSWFRAEEPVEGEDVEYDAIRRRILYFGFSYLRRSGTTLFGRLLLVPGKE